jgi:hypothetical protein
MTKTAIMWGAVLIVCAGVVWYAYESKNDSMMMQQEKSDAMMTGTDTTAGGEMKGTDAMMKGDAMSATGTMMNDDAMKGDASMKKDGAMMDDGMMKKDDGMMEGDSMKKVQ